MDLIIWGHIPELVLLCLPATELVDERMELHVLTQLLFIYATQGPCVGSVSGIMCWGLWQANHIHHLVLETCHIG